MKQYEVMFIVRPDLEKETTTAIAEEMKKVLTDKGANILEEKDMGQRELAYEMKKYKTGYYYFFKVESNDASATQEFTRVATLNENIIRSLVAKVED